MALKPVFKTSLRLRLRNTTTRSLKSHQLKSPHRRPKTSKDPKLTSNRLIGKRKKRSILRLELRWKSLSWSTPTTTGLRNSKPQLRYHSNSEAENQTEYSLKESKESTKNRRKKLQYILSLPCANKGSKLKPFLEPFWNHFSHSICYYYHLSWHFTFFFITLFLYFDNFYN